MNWKYILIVVILAAVVGGGILAYQYWWAPKEEAKMPEVKPPEAKVPEETKPVITILSPKGGERWEISSEQTIRWSYTGDFQEHFPYKSTQIAIICGEMGREKAKRELFRKIIASFDQGVTDIPTFLDWTVSSDVLLRDDCKIDVVYLASQSSDFGGMGGPEFGVSASSALFTVATEVTATPSITIIFPNGGENLKVGQTYTISWKTANLKTPVRKVELWKGSEFMGGLTAYVSIFDTSSLWKVEYPPESDYRIRVATDPDEGLPVVEDFSDAPFSITQ